jgi:hypothetical protein
MATNKQGDREPIMTLRRKSGQRVQLTLPDGRTGWITLFWQRNEYGKYVDMVLELPRDVRVVREESLTKPKATNVHESTDGR